MEHDQYGTLYWLSHNTLQGTLRLTVPRGAGLGETITDIWGIGCRVFTQIAVKRRENFTQVHRNRNGSSMTVPYIGRGWTPVAQQGFTAESDQLRDALYICLQCVF